MSEPVIAAVIAWVWLGESLDAVQLAGAAVSSPASRSCRPSASPGRIHRSRSSRRPSNRV